MATYAIGDLQGCAADFEALLDLIAFDPGRDHLWLTGDLVNRGPASLKTLRLVRALEHCSVVVLGNHDLHLLAASIGARSIARSDTISDILCAPDKDELLLWLRQRPLAHAAQVDGQPYLMVHAGVLPQWSSDDALRLAHEVELVLRSARWTDLCEHMYGNQPDRWDEELQGMARYRAIINVLTRLRFCTADGILDLKTKEGAGAAPHGFYPWFEAPGRRTDAVTVINGHWSTLGLRMSERHLSLDTGCVWGGQLTAARLEDRQVMSVPCRTHLVPGT